ncbi:MAG: hypothetical protein AB1679_31470 [Actinomycetota bacterium]
MLPPKLDCLEHSGLRRTVAPLLRWVVLRAVVVALVPGLTGVRPAQAGESLVPEARSGTFTGSPRGFFVCTYTETSPVETPDCFLGYVVPDGQPGQGRLRAVGSGFQRSSNFTVLEEVSADASAFTVRAGGATVDLTFPDLGRLDVRLVPGTGGPGWANSACPRTVLAYALAAGGVDASAVFPVAAAHGTLSRNLASEDVALYSPHRPVSCFAYFAAPASGAWRMSEPHSAGHRRFQDPPPDPRTPGGR